MEILTYEFKKQDNKSVSLIDMSLDELFGMYQYSTNKRTDFTFLFQVLSFMVEKMNDNFSELVQSDVTGFYTSSSRGIEIDLQEVNDISYLLNIANKSFYNRENAEPRNSTFFLSIITVIADKIAVMR